MVVESLAGERSDLIILLTMVDKQFALVSSSEIAEIGGVSLDVEGVQRLGCCDV